MSSVQLAWAVKSVAFHIRPIYNIDLIINANHRYLNLSLVFSLFLFVGIARPMHSWAQLSCSAVQCPAEHVQNSLMFDFSRIITALCRLLLVCYFYFFYFFLIRRFSQTGHAQSVDQILNVFLYMFLTCNGGLNMCCTLLRDVFWIISECNLCPVTQTKKS